MYYNVQAVVLWSRRSRDADKIVGLYTDVKGRLTARATSAAKPTAKFAGLTEPFALSEMAIYQRSGEAWGKIVGGRPLRTFPHLRQQIDRSTAAAWICEVVHRLTPEEQPSLEKFHLLVEALEALEQASAFGVLRLAFATRFLSLAGFGLDHRDPWMDLQVRQPEWSRALLTAPLISLGQETWSDPDITALEHLAGELVMDHLNRPLSVNRFRQMTGVNI